MQTQASSDPSDARETRVAVLYGTETGNAKECAEDLVTAIREKGFDSDAIDMGTFEPAALADEKLLFIVTSTYGNGDPPSNAEALHTYLQSKDAVPLAGLRFGVCALGDTTYPLFAQCGRDFDRFLEERGATRVIERVDCDSGIDYYEPFEGFQEQCLEYLDRLASGAEDLGAAPAAAVSATPMDAAPKVSVAATYAVLERRERLTRVDVPESTWHLELAFDGDAPEFEPGDSFAVQPSNDPEEVTRIVDRLGASRSETVLAGDAEVSLEEALTDRSCLQTVTGELARALGPHSTLAAEAAESVERLGALRETHDVYDLLRSAPPGVLGAAELVATLRPQAPRLYSVASSRHRHPSEVHFTVATFDRDRHGRTLRGTATSWLCERLATKSRIPLTLRANPRFRAAGAGAPMIMIGPGTGVAPFRGFLQDLDASGADQRAWLFFGHRRRAEDFLYEEEFLGYEKSGRLEHLSLAWSRDQAEKHYVQHEMLANRAEVWDWIASDGAHVYVCGDAQHMAPDVRRALQEIATTTGGVADGVEWLAELEASGRFCEDVY